MFSSCFGTTFEEMNEDEKLVDKFLKIVEKISSQSCDLDVYDRNRRNKTYYIQTHDRRDMGQPANLAPEELDSLLHPSFSSNVVDANRVLNLSSALVKRIKNLPQNPYYTTCEIDNVRNLKLKPAKDAKGEKKSYSWQELQFITFEHIVHLFECHCLHYGNYNNYGNIGNRGRLSNSHHIMFFEPEDNPKYFSQLIGNILKESSWLQCLELLSYKEDNLIKEQWKVIMFILISRLNVDDSILETLWTNEKIRIPIDVTICKHFHLASERFYTVDNHYGFAYRSTVEKKQIQLLARYTDPSVCQIVHFYGKVIGIMLILQNQYFSKLFEEDRLFYERIRVAKVGALVKLLDDNKFLFSEINKIIAVYCY
jgi:hypothetical protein